MTRVFYTPDTVWRQSKCHTNWYWIYWYCKFQSGKVGVYDIVNRIADIGMSSRRLSVQEVMFLSILVKTKFELFKHHSTGEWFIKWNVYCQQFSVFVNMPFKTIYGKTEFSFLKLVLIFSLKLFFCILTALSWVNLITTDYSSLCTKPSAITTVKPAYTTTSIRQPLVEDNQCWVRPSQFPYNCYCIRQSPV